MDNQNSKEKYLQKLLGARAKAQSTGDSLSLPKNLNTILESLVSAFPEGCFCPPSQHTKTQIKNALNDLFVWSVSAPISSGLRIQLQAAINTVKSQLDASPFSCCDTIPALQELLLVLSNVIDQPLVGTIGEDHLQNLLQQLQGIIIRYMICLTCEPRATGPVAYVTNAGDETVSIVNLTAQATTGSISGFNLPVDIAISPDGLTAYVVNNFNTVSIVNLTTQAIIGTISGFNSPFGIALSPNGLTAYVTNFGDNTVSIVNLTTQIITGTIPTFNFPVDIAISPDGLTAYVTNVGDNTVSIVNLTTQAITGTIPAFNFPAYLTLSPNGLTAYVTNHTGNTVSIVNLTTQAIIGTISGFNSPFGIALSPDGLTAYVTNVGDNTVSIVNLTTQAIINSISGLNLPQGMAIK
ncbi:YncE family protein [Bacillus cereus]|uniref:YncE family protein n=1 Tax=Bacillus cereus TaxID=1396 RepID=UPI000BF3D36B|nr:YncE family protein [Bacillus cereus]PFE80324.1 hypothetical protein CN319_09510 [Bacillus cereus]PGQ04719.1 hypothetical protein COA09_28090 [Bacillus cereus]PGV04981.1 hypothetical protein COD77_17755 [Bacillus cereus]